MHGATLLDADDKVLRPCILWNDTRSYREAAALDADPRFRALTGNIVFPGFTAPKLVWVENNEPEIFAKVAQGAAAEGLSAPLADRRAYLRNVGLGRHRPGSTPASAHWSAGLLAATGLDEGRCRSSSKARSRAGTLRAELAVAMGHGSGVSSLPAARATMRRRPAAWARSAKAMPSFRSARRACCLPPTARYLPKPESAVHAFCHALPNTWHQMGVILSATDALNWYSGDHRQERRRPHRRTRRDAEGAKRRDLPALSLRRAHAAQ